MKSAIFKSLPLVAALVFAAAADAQIKIGFAGPIHRRRPQGRRPPAVGRVARLRARRPLGREAGDGAPFVAGGVTTERSVLFCPQRGAVGEGRFPGSRMPKWIVTTLAPAAILCVGAGAEGPALAGAVNFDIAYVDEVEQTKPTVANYTINQHVVVTLHDGNHVTEQRNWRTRAEAGAISSAGALGETVPAGKFTVRWRVESQNSLIRYREFPQHVEVLKIAVSGASCDVTISHQLKNGFSEYERFDSHWEPVYYRSLRSSGISCRVQND